MASRRASALPADDLAPSGAGFAPTLASESSFDANTLEHSLGRPLEPVRWMGARLRLLVVLALLGCVGLFLLIRLLAQGPHIDAQWRASVQGQLELVSTTEPRLRGFEGKAVLGLEIDGRIEPMHALVLQRSPRWMVDDAERLRLGTLQDRLSRALGQRELRVVFIDGTVAELQPRPRGAAGLGAMFWLLGALALVLYLIAMVVLLVKPILKNALYAAISICQAGNLLFIALEAVPDLGLPAGFARWDLAARIGFDLFTVAAIVHATTIHPRPVPGHSAISGVAWLTAATIVALAAGGHLAHAWWWTQGVMIAFGLLAIALLSWSYRIEPHPFAVVVRRFSVVAVGTLVLLTIAIAAAEQRSGAQYTIASVGSVIWYVFLASLLLMVPFLSRSQQVMREFSMLAGISTVATSLDLLFVAVFSLGQFTSLTLSLFLSLGAYAGVRQWVLNQMIGSNMLTTERMFEQLYRIARDVEAHPEKTGELLSRLLRELFEPLEVLKADPALGPARVLAAGSALLVPVPRLGDAPDAGALVLRFAHRGKRMFTHDDARLTDRVLEQLKRAVAFDKAVEQGRSEERVRIAQDLHDDIGARLLTLMYKAPTPEMEDYLRHTLQDLKTLTRGLAAPSHRLSHAAAEWKADITQRLNAAHCDLGWSFSSDRDIALSVVQWSALTRMLRELVTNAIAHAQATRVDIEGSYERGRFTLTVIDNGGGRNPQAWSHGLGLGGVRKRVKQLGGEVEWREHEPQGIACRVRIPDLSERR
jgi:signal transduction histidine kinase